MYPFFTNYLGWPLESAFEAAVKNAEHGDALEIRRGGKRVAVLIGSDEYEDLTAAFDRLNAQGPVASDSATSDQEDC